MHLFVSLWFRLFLWHTWMTHNCTITGVKCHWKCRIFFPQKVTFSKFINSRYIHNRRYYYCTWFLMLYSYLYIYDKIWNSSPFCWSHLGGNLPSNGVGVLLLFCRRSPRAGGWTTPIGRRIAFQSGHRGVGFPKHRGGPPKMDGL